MPLITQTWPIKIFLRER